MIGSCARPGSEGVISICYSSRIQLKRLLTRKWPGCPEKVVSPSTLLRTVSLRSDLIKMSFPVKFRLTLLVWHFTKTATNRTTLSVSNGIRVKWPKISNG
jgi:hypothetical protein